MNNPTSLARILFDKYDTDKKGVISVNEFKSLAYSLGHYITDGEAKFAVNKIDENGDGLITFNEFQDWWKSLDRWKIIKYSSENIDVLSKLSEQFKKFDYDNSGTIDKDEFKIFIEELTDKHWVFSNEEEELFNKLDTNNDNEISFNEFIDYLSDKYNGDLSKHFTPVLIPREIFLKYDTENKGRISVNQFKSLAYDLGYYPSDGEAKFAVKQIDKDGNGYISYNAFEKWWENTDRWEKLIYSKDNVAEIIDLAKQFRKYDYDESGTIDRDEFEKFCYELINDKWISEEEQDILFEKIDRNGDEEISFNEFIDYLSDKYDGDFSKHFKSNTGIARILFDEYDKNKDGSISLEEFIPLSFDLGHFLKLGEDKITFEQIDEDGNGLISYEEFENWWKSLDRWKTLKLNENNAIVIAKLGEQFRKYDEDGNGTIDKDEFREFCRELSHRRWVFTFEEKAMFNKIDKNHNGNISFNEFINFISNSYDGDLSRHVLNE